MTGRTVEIETVFPNGDIAELRRTGTHETRHFKRKQGDYPEGFKVFRERVERARQAWLQALAELADSRANWAKRANDRLAARLAKLEAAR